MQDKNTPQPYKFVRATIYIYIYILNLTSFLGVFFNQKSVIESFDNNDMKSSKYNRKDSNVIISIYNFKVHTEYLVC